MSQRPAQTDTAQIQMCLVCGLVYDPMLGLPEHSIAPAPPGGRWPSTGNARNAVSARTGFEAM